MRRKWLFLLVIALAVAGCGGDKKSPAPTITPTPSRTALPPTWTPSPPGYVAPTWTPRPGAQQPTNPPKLPTWTPRPSWTPLVAVTQTPPTRSTPSTPLPTVPTATPFPQECYDLQAETGEVHITAGQPATISWKPIPRMPDYLVEVDHPGGGEIFSSVIDTTNITLVGDMFTVAGVYGWQVWPLDDSGEHVCFPISGEIIVTFGEEGPPQASG